MFVLPLISWKGKGCIFVRVFQKECIVIFVPVHLFLPPLELDIIKKYGKWLNLSL
jgi:hypothetical protein